MSGLLAAGTALARAAGWFLGLISKAGRLLRATTGAPWRSR